MLKEFVSLIHHFKRHDCFGAGAGEIIGPELALVTHALHVSYAVHQGELY